MFEDFGNRLEKLMKEQNISNKQMTEELELSKNAIGNCKKGEIPNTKTVYQLSQKLGVSMEFLLTGKAIKELSNEEQKIIDAYKKCDYKDKPIVDNILGRYMKKNNDMELSTSKIG